MLHTRICSQVIYRLFSTAGDVFYLCLDKQSRQIGIIFAGLSESTEVQKQTHYNNNNNSNNNRNMKNIFKKHCTHCT